MPFLQTTLSDVALINGTFNSLKKRKKTAQSKYLNSTVSSFFPLDSDLICLTYVDAYFPSQIGGHGTAPKRLAPTED